MAHVHLPSIGRDYEWDCAADGSASPLGTPTLQIYSGGHDGFIAPSYWVDKAMGGKGTAVAGTFSIAVWPNQNSGITWNGQPTDLLVLQCKGPDGKRWEICVDINGAVTNDWGQGVGTWQLP